MKTIEGLTRSVFASALLIAVINLPATTYGETVSTATPGGADIEMREQSNLGANTVAINTRTSGNGDRNEIIGLRFDLSGYTLANTTNVSLRLTSFRADSTRVVDFYGVAQGTTGASGYTTENWDETAPLAFGDLPGLLTTDGSLLSQSINLGRVSYLGRMTVSGATEGGAVIFSDPALSTFIRSYAGSSRVTFILAAGNSGTGQFRIASKEATTLFTPGLITGPAGTFAPALDFTVVDPCTNCPPEIVLQPTDRGVLIGQTATFQVAATGTAPLTYQWLRAGSAIPGKTNDTLAIPNAQTNLAGLYSVIVSNAFGSTNSREAALTVLAPRNVLISGAYMTSTIQSNLSTLGHTSTVVNPFEFATASFNGFDAIWLGGESSFNGLASRKSELVSFVNNGGVLLIEVEASGNNLNDYPFGEDLVAIATFGDNVHIVQPAHPINAELTDASLSNWSYAYHALFTSIGSFIGLCDNGVPGNWVTLWQGIGAGHVVYTSEDIAYHIQNGLGATGPSSAKGVFLNNVLRLPAGPNTAPPVIYLQPLNRAAIAGKDATFTVSATGARPLTYQWRFNGSNLPGQTNDLLLLTAVTTNQAGGYSVVLTNAYGAVTSSVAMLNVIQLTPAEEFQITSLTTNNSQVVDHATLTGNDRGGIAASGTHVFYSGDNSTAGFLLTDLSGGTALGTIYDAMASDLKSGKVYSFASDFGVLGYGGGVATRLVEHDSATGALTGNAIALTSRINLAGSGNVGIFSGYGRIIVHDGSKAYDIRLPSGAVIELGNMPFLAHQYSESWAYWGVAEYFGGNIHLTYVRDSQTIVRTAVPSGATVTLASFDYLSDMACITISIPLGRWYFHHQYGSQFGGLNETVGYADATFSVISTNPPIIARQPRNRNAVEGTTTTLAVSAVGARPLAYQWRFNEAGLANQTNATLLLTDVTTNQAGGYSVIITNVYGAITSVVATLTVIRAGPVAEFKILGLTTNNSQVIEHEELTSDDRGGIAASGTHVYYSGDASTARFSLVDLSGGATLGAVYDAMASDLESGKVYSLADDVGVLGSGGGIVTRLIELDGETGALTGNDIPLTDPINLTGIYSGNVGIFSGYGRIVVFDGSKAYDIRLPSGAVIELGNLPFLEHQRSENWAYWGVAEYFDGTIHLTYVRDNLTIVRTAVPGGTTETLAGFDYLSDMACITVSVPLGRWYFHHEGSSQFGGLYETLGYADATFSVIATNPPIILAQPDGGTLPQGESVGLKVLASGSQPLHFQWSRDGVSVSAATNAALVIDPVTTNDTGNYVVVVANAFGAVTSLVASLTILPPPTKPPNFDLVGFASVKGGTTGGEGGPVVTVNTAADFTNVVGSATACIVVVEGTIDLGGFSVPVRSNKTIVGRGTNATLIGNLHLVNASNIIIRNLFVTNPGGAGEGDGITLKSSATHVWIDHCTFYDCADGELDITQSSDLVTVSWCKFYYTFDTGHNFVNLIGASDDQTADRGKLNVTFHHNWWSALCVERMPRVRFGDVHAFNNFYSSAGNNYCLRAALESELLIENNYFRDIDTPWEVFVTTSTNGLIHASSNLLVHCTNTNNPAADVVFTPPYPYVPDLTTDVPYYAVNYAGVGKLAPLLLQQPVGGAKAAGSAVLLSVVAAGATPMTYQWRFNGTNIVGATQASLLLANVQKPDEGLYSVVVSNFFGSAQCADAPLLIEHWPVADASATATKIISPNGTNAAVILNGTRSFDPDGDLLSYSWHKNGSHFANGVVALTELPVGAHSILLVVSDGKLSGSNATPVVVLTLAQAIEGLIATVNTGVSRPKPLTATLDAALAAVNRGNPGPAVNQLLAFQNKVRAQIASSDPQLASQLIQDAQHIIDLLSEGHTNPAGRPQGKALSVHSVAGQRVALQFAGEPQRVYLIEATTNLTDWEVIGVTTARMDGSFEFEDPQAAHFSRRYYRSVLFQ